MKNIAGFILVFLSVLTITACNNVTYIPKSKKTHAVAAPSILIFERIVDFRMEHHGWPVSKDDFISKGKKYFEVMEKFEYMTTSFKVIDSNRMTFYFSDYRPDMQRYERTKEVDLNSFSGSTKFWKENGKFLWKTRMN